MAGAISALPGVDLPIVQAPMAGSQNWELAVAVARGGGLGSIPCGMLTPPQVVREIESFRAASGAAFNLNFFCHSMASPDEQVMERWQACLQPYYRQFGLTPGSADAPLRRPFDEAMAQAIEPFAPPVISFHFGLPPAPLLARVKSWGAVVLSTATTVDEGCWLQDNGADLVIAQGLEAGGHRGMFLTDALDTQLPLESLLPQLLRELALPVIAAGGIAGNQEVRRCLEAGAAAVQVGTSYLLCVEATTSPVHRAALAQSGVETALTNVFSGRPARGIRNRLMQDLGDISASAPPFPHAAGALAPLRKYAEQQHSGDFSPLWSGQNRTGCKMISAMELTRELGNVEGMG